MKKEFIEIEALFEKAKNQYADGDTAGAVETMYKVNRLSSLMESKLRFELHQGKEGYDAIIIK